MGVVILLVSFYVAYDVVGGFELTGNVGCGTRFVDLVKGYHIMAGYDNVIFGAGVPGVGRDGIMAGNARLNARVESAMGEIIEEKKVRCEKFEAEEKLEEKKFCCDGDEGYVLRSVEP